MDPSRLLPADWPSTLAPVSADTLVAALVSAVVTLALIVGFAARLPIGRRARAQAPAADATACDFLLLGSSVRALTEPARALLADLGPGPSPMAALAAHLARDCPDIQRRIEALALYGTGFREHVARGDGSACEIAGQPHGGAALLTIRQPSDDARALQDARTALARAVEELRFLRDVIDLAPVQVWSIGPDGQVTWANGPYREAFDTPAEGLQDHRIPNAFGHVLEEVPLTARGAESRARVSVPAREGAEPRWYEICRCPGPDGATLGFAVEADDLVAAEASLRRFIETLTETFAHLPIGLAVFDKNRRLGLFNPALTELVRIDAVWLAGRPSLRDFLERLRETRQMPEQKDFAAWRRKLGELEEGARDGTYEENWVLPSGKVFRVTGRPHPQGALAFLFEDISTAIQLERRYRSELELSQATLDRLTEAVAVFDASGSLVFVNSAFEALWELDSMERLDGPGVAGMAAIWAERCCPSAAWADLGEYATAAEARGSWTAAVETREGRRLQMAVAPLPDASTLVVFRDAAAVPGSDPLLDALALDAALGTDDGPVPALAAAFAARGLALAVTGPDAALADPALRRTVLALGLAGAELAAPGATVEIGLDATPAGRRVTLAGPAGPMASGAESLGMALARRVVEASGGKLRVEPSDGRFGLAAELPPAVALDAPLPAGRTAIGG